MTSFIVASLKVLYYTEVVALTEVLCIFSQDTHTLSLFKRVIYTGGWESTRYLGEEGDGS